MECGELSVDIMNGLVEKLLLYADSLGPPLTLQVSFTSSYPQFNQLLLMHTVHIGVKTDFYGFGPSTQPILIQDVECSGNERNISECMHSEVNNVISCLHVDDAGVICEGNTSKPEEPLTKYF